MICGIGIYSKKHPQENRIIHIWVHIYLAYLLQHSLGSNMKALGKIAFLSYGQYLPNSRDKKRVVARDITIVYDGLFAIH